MLIKECKKHDWRVGAFIGAVAARKIHKKGVYIRCYKCGKEIRAYYNQPVKLRRFIWPDERRFKK